MPAKYRTKRGRGRPRKRRAYTRRKIIINRIVGTADTLKANN